MDRQPSTRAPSRTVPRHNHGAIVARPRTAFSLLGAAMCAIVAGTRPAPAAPLPSGPAQFRYTVIDARLADAVQQFGRDVGLRVNVSDAVEGRVTSRLSVTGVRQFLDALSSNYGLDWYYDGFALYVTTNAEALSRTVRVPGAGVPALRAMLLRDGVADERFPLHATPGSREMRISGPPRFVSLVERTAAALSSPTIADAVPASATTVVFRGSGSQRINFGEDEKP